MWDNLNLYQPPCIKQGYLANNVACTIEHTWMCILMIAFPMRVAPKKVQNGMRKCPQVMPARSNRGLGI